MTFLVYWANEFLGIDDKELATESEFHMDHNLYNLELTPTKLQTYYHCINDAIQYFPISTQQALVIKLLNDWKSKKNDGALLQAKDRIFLKIARHVYFSFDWTFLREAR